MSDPTIPPDLRRLAERYTAADAERLEPPASVWEGIEAEVGRDDAVVTSLTRRLARPKFLLAAAVTLAIVAVGAAALWSAGDGDDGRTVVATTAITSDGLPVVAADGGEARLVEANGRLELELDVPDLPSADGFYEVWIIDSDVDGMFSLGVVDGDGRYVLPSGVDPADFPVVDVSVEPRDGDPTHSGQSILRGTLDL